jgi:hypothetical protein
MKFEKEYAEFSRQPVESRQWSIRYVVDENGGNLPFIKGLVDELIKDAASFEPPVHITEEEVDIKTTTQMKTEVSYTATGNPPASVTDEYSITRFMGNRYYGTGSISRINGRESETVAKGTIYRERKKPEEEAKKYKNRAAQFTASLRREARHLAHNRNRQNWARDIAGRHEQILLTADDMISEV